jgi:hypothetical protein
VSVKNIAHTYTVDSPGGYRILLICSQAGFQNFDRSLSNPVNSLVPPLTQLTKIDYEKVMMVGAEFGVEFVGLPAR